jgi:hypothetical protein
MASLAVSVGSDISVSQWVVGKVCYELRKGDEMSTRCPSFDWYRNRFYSETQRARAAFAAERKIWGRQDCEGDYRSWHIAICSSDAAMDDFVAFF